MELVYLWVENYKNIHEQEFKFSPRFTCNYDKEKNELTIDENEGYIENFFGDNINVTAVVGKNGSGKSAIVGLLNEILQLKDYKAKILDESSLKYLLIYREGNEWQKFGSIDLISDIKIENNEYINFKHYIYLASEQKYISNYGMFDEDNYIDIVGKNRLFLNEYMIAEMLTEIYISEVDFNLTSFMYVPHEIELKPTQKRFEKLVQDMKSKHYDDFMNFEGDYEKERKMRREAEQKTEMLDNELYRIFEHLDNDYHQFILRWYMLNHGIEMYLYSDVDMDDIIGEFKQNKHYLTEDEFKIYFKESKKSISDFSDKDKSVYFNWYKDEFKFDFVDSKKRRYSHLSHGEQTIFGLFLNLYYVALKNTNEPISFLLDEPDLSLHPEWQRKYISDLESLLKKLNNKFHIIITSHSPFLLSDLPKQNIIFLDTYKEDTDNQKVGNCKVLKYDEVLKKKQTFGQNIHTLLSDSFFMDDGLMGEFAKNKIEDVINFLQGQKSKIQDYKEAEAIISIIGEPILKMRLEKMLDDYKIKQEIETEEDIQKKIDELNQKLKKMKNGKDTSK